MKLPATPQPTIATILPFFLNLLLIFGIAGTALAQAQPFAYVTNANSNNVSVIDTATNTEVDVDGNSGNGITRITVGSLPEGVAVTPDGGFVYVANLDSDNVSVIDTSTNTVTDTVSVGDGPFAFGQFIRPATTPACIGTGRFRIKGRVQKSIAGATMTLRGPDDCASTVTTDSGGRYEFPTLAGGDLHCDTQQDRLYFQAGEPHRDGIAKAKKCRSEL